MNVWTVKFEEHWSYDKKNEWQNNGLSFNVVAGNGEEAVEKAKKMAKLGRVYKDDDGDDYSLEAVRILGLERGVSVHG